MSRVLVHLDTAPAAATASVPVQDPPPPPGRGPEFGEASPIALVVIVLLALATAFLIRSMGKHLRRVPASFDAPPEHGLDEGSASGTGGAREPGGATAEPEGDRRPS